MFWWLYVFILVYDVLGVSGFGIVVVMQFVYVLGDGVWVLVMVVWLFGWLVVVFEIVRLCVGFLLWWVVYVVCVYF